MKTSKILFGLALALVMLVSMVGAVAEPADGTWSGSAQGFGGEVVVNITIEGGKITAVQADGAGETPNIGLTALDTLSAALVEKQDAELDGVAGATVSSNAFKAATAAALNAASGIETVQAAAELADGTYTASAWGFSKNYKLNVQVTVKDNAITEIAIADNAETEPILQSAIDLLIPRMLEHQSVKVDAVTGATASSTAIKLATEDCLVQAIEAAGGDRAAVSQFYVVPEKLDAHEEIVTDVLVVGMGGSGIATATHAAQLLYEANGQDASKVNVLGIDKAGKYGGTSANTTSPMTINPSYFVNQNNGENYVDAQVLKAAWMEYTEGDAKEWAIDKMMEVSGPAIDWLIEQGFVFGEPAQGLSEPYKVCVNYGNLFGNHKALVGTYFDGIAANFKNYGGKIMLETEATSLIVEDGKVVGINAVNANGTTYTIRAKAVVLATGGFAGNGEMQNEYLSDVYYPQKGAAYNVYGMTQNDGKMIQSAIDNGAATYNIGMPPMSHIGGAAGILHLYDNIVFEDIFDIWTGKAMTQSLNDVPMMMAVAPNALAVNRDGVRFVDETALSTFGNWQAGPYFYTIWSNEQIQEIKNEGFRFGTLGLFVNQGGWPANTPIPEMDEILAAAEEAGIIVSADSLEQLAQKIGMDASVLTKTVSDYNAYMESGENPADGIVKGAVVYDLSGMPVESEKSTFQKVEGDGPYYAVKSSPWIYSTCGGLDINEQYQVLKTDGSVLDGLYAVGTDSMGILFTEKKEYVAYGGAAQGWAFTSGYEAGSILADMILAE